MGGGVLVAGVGNIFLGDDGFGPEVVRRFAAAGGLPPRVRAVDYGIRGMHLAYDLLDGCDALVLVDALGGDGPPGTVTVLEVGADDLGAGEFDAHGMHPAAVLGCLEALGGRLPACYVVGCVPADVGEGIGLSETVASAVPEAITAVRTLLTRLCPAGTGTGTVPGTGRVSAAVPGSDAVPGTDVVTPRRP